MTITSEQLSELTSGVEKLLKLHWLAGLLEGEGSFMPPSPSAPKLVRINITMTDKDVIEQVAKLVGVKYIHKRTPTNENWKPSYRITILGTRAVNLMVLLRALMGERRKQQIDKALASI